jgi:putative effector of murein hydrolase
MPKFVELWVYLSATPLFGLTATLVVYVLAQAVYAHWNQAAWANPVLWSVVVLASLLSLSGVDYPTYFSGAQFIHFLLGPAVVALAWPLWERRLELRRHWRGLLLAALLGGVAASGSALLLGWLVNLPHDVVLSLAPKSVTAPVAMGIADKIGGIPALAAVFAVVTGMVGALSAGPVFNWLGIGTSGGGLANPRVCCGHHIPWHRRGTRAANPPRCRCLRGPCPGHAGGLGQCADAAAGTVLLTRSANQQRPASCDQRGST